MKTAENGQIKYRAIVWDGEKKIHWYFTSDCLRVYEAWADFQSRHPKLTIWDVERIKNTPSGPRHTRTILSALYND